MASTDLHIDQRAKYEVTFTYCAPSVADPSKPGDPIDITGYTALMQLREDPGAPLILELTDLAGITVGGEDGVFAIFVHAAQTAALPTEIRACKYDLFVTPPDAEQIKLVRNGRVFIGPAISVPSS